MSIDSILYYCSLYFIFWVLSAFCILPLGVQTPDETGDGMVQGQATSAPVNFQPWLVVKRTTVLSAILYALFLTAYHMDWFAL
jgi:predicted secreted protein